MVTARWRFFATIASLLLATPAAANSGVCDGIFQQLSRTRAETIGADSLISRYEIEIARQNTVIRRLKNNLRQAGCSSGSIIVYGNSRHRSSCGEIEDRITDAEDYAQELRARREEAMMRPSHRSERQMLLAALSANGCDSEQPSPVSITPESERNILQPDTDGSIIRFGSPYGSPQQGGLRTLCVRTCDGAFFPISSNASPMDFARQANQCASMCPGTETELYYHSLTGQESTDMVSTLTGRPYKELPTAFVYRNTPRAANPQCGCNLPAFGDEAKQDNPDPSKEPEDHSSVTRIGPEIPIKPEESTLPPPERDYRPQENNIRIVGPEFLPSQGGDIDLMNPAVKGAQPLQQ